MLKWFAHLRRIVEPLRSRKVRVALTTVLAAYLAEYGLEVSEQIVLTILATGVALILGIAHEDAGRQSAPASKPPDDPGWRQQAPAIAGAAPRHSPRRECRGQPGRRDQHSACVRRQEFIRLQHEGNRAANFSSRGLSTEMKRST